MERVKLAGFGRNGFIQDVAEYDAPPESFNEVRNARFNSIGAIAFSGHRSVLSPAPITPTWLRVFPPVDHPLWVYADNNRVYAFDDGHVEITRLSGPYSGISSERWQGEVLSGVGLFNNTVDVPQMWTQFSAGTKLQDLSNWPANLRCKFLRPFKYYAIAGFLTESGNDHPFRVRWSHPADPGAVPSSWVVNNPAFDSGEFEISETDDYIVDGMTLGEAFFVYKQKSVYMMYLTGDQKIFGQRLIIPSKGALTRDCVRPIPGGHFVAGFDDIYVHSGQKGSEQSVVEAKLRNWIYNQIDASNFFNCFLVKYERQNEIWFCFPEAGETYATIAVIFNTLTGGIGIRDLQQSPFIWPGPVDDRTDDGDIWGGEDNTAVGALVITHATLAGAGAVSSVPNFQTALGATGSIADGANFTAGSELDFGTGSFSMESWCKRGASPPDTFLGRIFTTTGGGGDTKGFRMVLTAQTISPFKLRLTLDGTGGAVNFDSSDLTGTGWHHYAITVNRSTNFARFFQDGVFINQVDISSVSTSVSTSTLAATLLDGFIADIDEVRIWNDVRTDLEISTNWNKEISSPTSDSSLVAYYKFNEGSGSTTTDASTSGRTATLAGSGAFTTGPP